MDPLDSGQVLQAGGLDTVVQLKVSMAMRWCLTSEVTMAHQVLLGEVPVCLEGVMAYVALVRRQSHRDGGWVSAGPQSTQGMAVVVL